MASETSVYVPVRLPCHPEVKCYVSFCLDRDNDLLIPDRNSAVGREVLRVFRKKSRTVASDRITSDYEANIIIGVRQGQLLKMGTMVTEDSIREMNLQLTAMLKESLYRHLQLSMMANVDYNIKEGIMHWMAAVGITDDVCSVEAYKRSYLNWRLRNAMDQIKEKGRPRRAQKYVNEKMFLESFHLTQH